MTDQHSTSDDDDEPVRFRIPQPSIDEYLEYDPETDSYYAPDTPSKYDVLSWRPEYTELKENERHAGVTDVDGLRADGAPNDSAAKRKSLGAKRTPLFDLLGDDDTPDAEQAASDDEDDESSE